MVPSTRTSSLSPRWSMSAWVFALWDSLLTFIQMSVRERRPRLWGSFLPQLLSSVFCSGLTCSNNQHPVCALPCGLREMEPSHQNRPQVM